MNAGWLIGCLNGRGRTRRILAGMGRIDRDHPRAVPAGLVFQHPPDLMGCYVQHRAVQPGLGRDVAVRLTDRAGRSHRHVVHPQVLDDDQAVVPGYRRRRLVRSILAPSCQLRLEPCHGQPRLAWFRESFVFPAGLRWSIASLCRSFSVVRGRWITSPVDRTSGLAIPISIPTAGFRFGRD